MPCREIGAWGRVLDVGGGGGRGCRRALLHAVLQSKRGNLARRLRWQATITPFMGHLWLEGGAGNRGGGSQSRLHALRKGGDRNENCEYA